MRTLDRERPMLPHGGSADRRERRVVVGMHPVSRAARARAPSWRACELQPRLIELTAGPVEAGHPHGRRHEIEDASGTRRREIQERDRAEEGVGIFQVRGAVENGRHATDANICARESLGQSPGRAFPPAGARPPGLPVHAPWRCRSSSWHRPPIPLRVRAAPRSSGKPGPRPGDRALAIFVRAREHRARGFSPSFLRRRLRSASRRCVARLLRRGLPVRARAHHRAGLRDGVRRERAVSAALARGDTRAPAGRMRASTGRRGRSPMRATRPSAVRSRSSRPLCQSLMRASGGASAGRDRALERFRGRRMRP